MRDLSKEIRDRILDPSIETYVTKCRENNHDNDKIEKGLKNLLKIKAITVDEYAKGMELIYGEE